MTMIPQVLETTTGSNLFIFDIHAIVGVSAKDERSVLRFCQESFL